MVKFTHFLFAAGAVICLTGQEADAVNPTDLVGATPKPKVIAASKADILSVNTPKRAATRRVAAKKAAYKFQQAKTSAMLAQEADETIYTCSFDFLNEGSETAPAPLELDDWDNIPEELVGEENYGFGGQGIMQAGGAVYVPFEYLDESDPDDPWEMEGLLWTPDIFEPMTVTVELDVKIVEGGDNETDELWVYASDYSNLLDNNYEEISTEWNRVSITLDCTTFVSESDYDSYYFTLFADNGSDIVIKDIVIKGEKAALEIPTAEKYTDYTGTSFTAHWSEVENATGYYLTVYNYDAAENTPTTKFLDAQFTEETSYTVTGITPGDFYSYEVTATDGSFTTAPSNAIIVCELPSPTDVEITPSADFKTLNFSWTASAGANYYVLTASSRRNVTGGEAITLADADFSGIESDGTIAAPVESDYWYDTLDELPGWQFTLGCSASGAYGFMDSAYYTALTGLYASLESMDYDLSNIKDGTVNVNIEAASPGSNGMLAGMITLNTESDEYEVASAYGTPGNLPDNFESYTFSLTGAGANSHFLFMTRTENNADGALLIRTLKITGTAESDGTVALPIGTVETDETECAINCELENDVTYTAYITPYLVDNEGYIVAVGQPSEVAEYKAEISGIDAISAPAANGTVRFYNLQGLAIDRPAKGSIVIKVTGDSATKIVY